MSEQTIQTQGLPTHIARVAGRLRILGLDNSADSFLAISYLCEVSIKTIAIGLWSGLRISAPEIAYAVAYRLVRGDGLGDWESTIQQMSTQPVAGYLPPAFQSTLNWLSQKRKPAKDDWFLDAIAAADKIVDMLGVEFNHDTNRPRTVRHLLKELVLIRNKTKAHGAVGPDFFSDVNRKYFNAVAAIVYRCPLFRARWMHLSTRVNKQTIRGILLDGPDPSRIPDTDCESFLATTPGIYFSIDGDVNSYFLGDLFRTTIECKEFLLPNGGYTNTYRGEFVDYATGNTEKYDLSKYAMPPAPLPESETHGLSELDVQSSVFGNLPRRPGGYVERPYLQELLKLRLLDRNHPIITLHGRGGIGKTSLALWAAYELADDDASPYGAIVWFSARDVDLRATGPSPVKAAVVDLGSVAKAYGDLFGADTTEEAFAKVLQSPDSDGSGTLYVFDNFETFSDARQLHKFLDTHTHLPNKILMTSRERAFKADYPIEVRGMEEKEAEDLLKLSGRELGVEGLLTRSVVESIHKYTDGHPYVMRIIVGEMAKQGRYVPVKDILPRRSDIVNAVFERSFNKLSQHGKWVFLIVANSKIVVPELALAVICAERELDAEEGAEECVRLSLLAAEQVHDGSYYYWAPELARVFARKKLDSDQDRLTIQAALEDVRKFGVYGAEEWKTGSQGNVVEAFIRNLQKELDATNTDSIARHDVLLEKIAELYPPAWLYIAQFRRHFSLRTESIEYALRRSVEEHPYSRQAWLERAEFAREVGDEGLYISSLVSAVDAEPSDVELLRDVSFELCQFLDAHKADIPKTRRGVYLAGVRRHMEAAADELDASALSRLAWLFLLEDNKEGALKYAKLGLERDPINEHCLRIVERLDGE